MEKRIQMARDTRTNNCLKMSMQLKGQRGAVEAIIYTHWYTNEHNQERRLKGIFQQGLTMGPVLFHSPIPLGWPGYEPEDPYVEATDCKILGGPCYMWNGLLSEREEEVLQALIDSGEDAAWAVMEEMYALKFGPDTAEREIKFRKFGRLT